MRSKLSGVTCLVLFLSVLKGCSTEVCGCVQYDTKVQFNFVDQNGNSLLNPDHPQTITEPDIDMFFVKNGQNITAESHFSIANNASADRYYLLFKPDLEAEDGLTVAHIEFNESEMDTIKVQVDEEDDFTRVTRVWYNGELRWDIDEYREENPSRYREIRKEF